MLKTVFPIKHIKQYFYCMRILGIVLFNCYGLKSTVVLHAEIIAVFMTNNHLIQTLCHRYIKSARELLDVSFRNCSCVLYIAGLVSIHCGNIYDTHDCSVIFAFETLILA